VPAGIDSVGRVGSDRLSDLLCIATLTTGQVLAAIAGLGSVALLAIWFVPRRQARAWRRDGIDGKDLAELEANARSTMVQVLGGVALLLTFVATWLQISDTRRATDRTLQLTATQQETERYSRAVEGLGAEGLDQRVGGIYGLEGVAEESARLRTPVVQVLLAYLRRHSEIKRPSSPTPGQRMQLLDIDAKWACKRHRAARVPDDVNAAFQVVSRFAAAARPRYVLGAGYFAWIRAPKADLGGAEMRFSSFIGANLEGASLDRAILTGTDFRGACLRHASVRAVVGDFPSFADADLSYARLSGGPIVGWTLAYADLRGADLAQLAVPRSAIRHARIDVCTRLPWRRGVPSRCPRAGPGSP
jgi:hypothetical protein